MVITHAFAEPSNRSRWERLAQMYPNADVTLLTPWKFRELRYGALENFRVEGIDRGNYRVIPVRTSGRRGFYRRLPRILRRIQPDIVHVFAEPTQWMLLQFLATSRLFAPRAVRLFNYFTNILDRPDRKDRRVKQAAVFRLAHGVSVGSEGAAKVVRDLGFRGECWTQTAFGVDERTWTPSVARDEDHPLTIGFLGALTSFKGVDVLIEAVSSLGGDWRLLIGGGGPERGRLERLAAESAPTGRVSFLGMIARRDAPGFMKKLDVLVLPTRTLPSVAEQFGFVLVEAMLSGVAVIGSDSGAIPEVVGDAGLIFPQGDAQALAEHLRSLQEDAARCRDLAARGRERALRLYSATALATEAYNLYSELVVQHRDVPEPSFGS
jgi:glycosyltransferase involved in cell wall biosynthesis